MFNEEDRQWLYDQFKSNGYDTGSYDEFVNSLNNDEDFKWWHEQAAGLGLEVGDINEFGSLFRNTPAAKAKPAKPTRAERENARKEENARLDKEIQDTVDQFGEIRAGQTPESSSIEDIPQKAAAYMESNPVEGKSPRDLEVEALREEVKANDEFVKEYDRSFAEYNNDLDNDLTGPDQEAKKEWLDANNEQYRNAKEAAARLQGMLNLATHDEEIERIEEKKKDNQTHVARKTISTGGLAPGYDPYVNSGKDIVESSKYEAANEILSMAEQTLNQGSKYDPGYEGNALEQVWTAATQFVEGAINNIDMGSLTFGASEGASLTLARRTGDKSNEIVDKTLKDMKVSDKQVNDLLSSVDEDAKKLNVLSEELTAEAAELEAMGTTIEDMKRSGESDAKINEYIKKYNSKLKSYNSKIKNEYEPLKASYDKSAQQYETIMSAVDAALESGLTDGEKALLDALEEYTDAKIKRANDVSVASAAGAGAEQSAEFMLDFILTGGFEKVGAKAALKLTERRIMKKFGKEAAMQVAKPSFGAKVLTDMGVAAARTTAMFPRNLAAYGEQLTQMTGKDQFGRYNFDRSHLNAAFNTALTQYIEYWSEGFGEYFGAAEQAAFKRVARRAPHSMIGQTLGKYRGTIGSYLDQGKFNGMFNEMLEEVVGSTFNALAGWMSNDRVGDKEAMKDFFSGEQLATLALSFLPMSAISAGTNIRAYNKMKERYDNSVTKLNPFIRSGAIEQKDLEALTTNIEGKTPEQITSEIAAIADKAREKNGGRLPEDFTQNLLGYVEGAYSMSLNAEAWEGLEPVVSAYTEQYANPYAENAYDLNQAEQRARAEAASEGWSESDLDKDAEVLAKIANEVNDPALAQYAQVKAANKGLKDGYDNETAQINKERADAILKVCDNNGHIIRAILSDGQEVFITSKDATVKDGKLVVPTGADGLVTYVSPAGEVLQAKVSTFTSATEQDTETFLLDSESAFADARELMFQQAQNTISPTAKVAAVSELVGNTILIEDGNGNVSSVNIINFNPQTGKATIKDERGNQREVLAEDLYDSAQKNPSGDIELDPNAKENEQALTPAQPEAPAQPADDLDNLIGTTVTISLNGKPVSVEVGAVNDAEVEFYYKDANGNEKGGTMSREEFAQAMQSANAPVAETPEEPEAPVAEEPAEQPASTLPVKSDGSLDWKNMFNVPAEEFAKRIPELVEAMNEIFGVDAMNTAVSWYQKTKKELDEIKKGFTGDPEKDVANAAKRKEKQQLIDNYTALITAMRPAPAAKPATEQTQAAETNVPEAPVEENVPDVSNDTPAAARARGYIVENGNRIDRPAEDAVVAEGADTNIAFTKTQVVKGKYGLVEATRVVPSHISDQENPLHFFARDWQPKDRRRTDSAVALQQMANNLRPEEITRGATAYGGAPVVNDRGEVIQGNGRSEGLRRAYAQNTAEGYKTWLADHAEDFGLTREQVEAMDSPVLVRVLDVTDDEALALGQKTQSDLESGGNQRIDGNELAKKLGDRLGEATEILFGGELDDDATITDYVNKNGALLMKWLSDNGFINETEVQNAYDDKGRFTESTISALRDMALSPLFQNGSQKVKEGYDNLPNIAKLAIQKSVAKIVSAPELVADLQDALAYYFDFLSDEKFRGAKTAEDAWAAIVDFMKQLRIEDGMSEGELHPSIVARRFAAIFKGTKSSKSLVDLFSAIVREMQGETNLFGTTEATDRIGAYERANVISAEEANILRNGEQGNNEPGTELGPGTPGESGEQGSAGDTGSGSEVPAGERGGAEGETGTAEEVPGSGEIIPEPISANEGELTEEEIRNSGYPDADVIDAAVDYIKGDRSFSNGTAYQLVNEYVRSQRNATESAGDNADGTQLDGPVVRTAGMGAEQSGGEGVEVGGSAQEGTAEREPGDTNGRVPSGEGSATGTEAGGLPANVGNTGSDVNRGRAGAGERGRSSDVIEGQGEPTGITTESRGAETPAEPGNLQGDRGRGGERDDAGREVESGQRSAGETGATAAGSTDIEALGGELEDLLKQFSATSPSIDRDIRGLDSVDYSTDEPTKEEGRLSRKQVKKPTAPLSLEGLSPQQAQLAGKIIFTSAKLGYAYAKTEGLTTYNDFHRWFTQKFGDAVMKGLNYDESSLDAFIREVWGTKLKIDDKRITLEEHASELHNEELRKEGEQTLEERSRKQKEANAKKYDFVPASRKNIAAALPQLTPGQWDDVVAIERQFFDPTHNDYDHAFGKGMLITNGTGTGKTYTGLGTIKRFVDQGKTRILLVAPANMADEWVTKGNAMGIKMSRLADTKDKGKGVVVTSYENFRENRALYEDTFDLVVYDECQNIIENQKGEDTLAYEAHKRITNKNIDEATDRLIANTVPGRRKYQLEQEDKKLDAEQNKKTTKEGRRENIIIRREEIANEIKSLNSEIALLRPQFLEEAEKAVAKTKVLMLSATPFNTVRNLKYAEGYIYQYPKVFRSDGSEVTNEEARRNAFETEWFRGDEPIEDLEVAFGDHLLDDLETVSFRELENGFDHSRDFPDVKGNIMAARFNAAWMAIQKDPRFNALSKYADFLTNPIWSSQLFETMKVSAIRERLKEHLDAGRKIVIFHDRLHETKATDKMPAVGPPFATVLDQAMNAKGDVPVMAITLFRQTFADVLAWEQTLDYRPVNEQVVDLYATDKDRAKYAAEKSEYEKKYNKWIEDCREYAKMHPEMTSEELAENLPREPKKPKLEAESVAVFNGECTNKEKDEAKAAFNNDESKVKIICVTTRSGGAGLSLHDTTGKHPRVLIQTALPVSPIGFIQAEGRIFRWGNRSNAIFEYPRLGLDLEAFVFAYNFNAKAETVENLAHGFRGRGLKDSIMTAFYEHSGNVPIDGQGIGGVEMDKRGNTLKGMAKAKHDYGVAKRKGIKEGDKSIPEPIGFKLAEWGKAQAGDAALIPFAGRGTITRYIPKGIAVSALEPDTSLQADLMVTSGGADFKLREGTFANLNVVNKGDIIILNGKETGNDDLEPLAALKKGFDHLSEGGRLIAIIPDTADANYVLSNIRNNGGVVRATIQISNDALDRGEGKSRIIIIDRVTNPALRATAGEPKAIDLSKASKEEVFDLIDNVNIPDRIIDKKFIALKKLRAVAAELKKNKFVESVEVYDDAREPSIGIVYGRRPTGASNIKWRIDDLDNGRWYHAGKWSRIRLSDFDKVTASNEFIERYLVAKDVVQMVDEDLRNWALLDSNATSETIENLREIVRLYMKLIRAGFGLTEAQIMRVAQGLRPEISAGDIETLNSYEELRAKFEASNNGDEERQDLYDKVAPVGEKLGLVIGAEAMDRDFLGGYNNVDNSLKINKIRWNGLSDDKRAETLLHEFIHSVSVYALAAYNTNAPGVSDELFDAAKLANDVYDQLTKGLPEDVRPFTGYYAIENVKELLAEMANNEFREKLKSRRMWIIRSSRGVRVSGTEMEGAELANAWSLLNESLDGMLKHFDRGLFDRFKGRANDFFWKVDPEQKVYRDADNELGDDYVDEPEEGLTEEEANTDGLLFREEDNPEILDRLEAGEKINVYRAMQLIDGKLYPPMSARVDGKMRDPVAIGKWERSEENPTLADDKGYFVLNKGNGASLKAKYNPYIHTSRTPLNDQFTSAYNRPNLVTVEVQVPASELTSGYKAEKAKDAVGEMTWHSGPVSGKLPEGKKRKVILSRWDKPIRVLTDSEVAQRIAELLDGENISIPYNVVTPGLRAELEKLGVQISDTPSGKVSEIRTRESGTTELAAKEARVSALELHATEKVLDSMSEQLGIKINKVSRRGMPVGHKTSKGYYNTKTGEMTICMDNLTDERDAIATVLHETVGHHGLRKLFGARFNEVMTRIFSMLDRDGRKWVLDYMNRHDLKPGNAEDIIVGVEEYLSHLAEDGNFLSEAWDKIKAFFGKVIDSLFGTQGFFLTDNELRYILRASYENLINPNWADTVEGKAMDTLFKRELGINETDRSKPTDPEAESADIRWRDGDTGVANLDYDADMKDVGVLARMEVQDADLPVRKAMDRIMKEVGKESIAENEDFVTRHNQASSRAESQAHEFKTFCFDPLIGQIRGLIDRLVGSRASQSERDEAYQKVKRYIYAVSGLERNAYKNNEIEAQKQDALTAARQAAAQKKQGKTAVEQRAIDSLLAQQEKEIEQRYEDMKRDWSGLTSLMEEGDWRKAENKARTMVASFSKEIGDTKALDALWDAIRACTDYSLDHALKHGLLTREEYNKLHGTATEPRMWEHYVPLRGFAAGTAEDSYSYETLTRPATNSVVTKKMKGRLTEADDPIANIFHIALTEIVQGNENWAKQALYRFVLDAGQNSLLSVREPWFVKNERTGTWSMAEPYSDETYEEFEERMEEKREKGEAKKGRQNLKLDKIVANKGHRNEHLIKLKIGGIEKAIWVNGNPAVAQAVAGMDRANNMKLIRRASRALSNLFTTYSLDFTARNLMRDTIYSRLALIMKEDNAYRHQFKKNWWKNFGYGAFAFPMVKMMAEWESGKLQRKANPTKRERQFIEFMRDGGQTGYTIVEGLDKIKRDMERAMRSAKPGRTVTIPVLGHIAEAIRVLNEGFELLTRFTAYQTSRDMGRSGQRSASDAKEISVNFNRRGAQTGKGVLGGVAAYFGATHYFFNAGVQGFENFLHLFKVAPGKMSASVAGFAAFGMIVPLLNSMLAGLAAGLGGDDDDRVDPDWYWNLPEWVRRNNMVFGVGEGYIAIPLPVELRAIYGIGDIAAGILYRKAPKNGQDIALDVMSTAAEILPVNPIEGYNAGGNLGDVFIRPLAPDALMFFVDVATNRDYTGRPLTKENPFNKTTPRSQSAYASTPKALVDACQWLYSQGGPDISPGVVRDFLKNYGGGLYKLAEDVTKEIVADEQRPRRWDDIPFLSGFTGHIDEDRKNSFAFNTYYQYKELSQKVVKDLNGAAMTDKISEKMAYETPELMPKGARTQMILEGEDYILGKMFYEANKNTYQMARRKRTTKYGKKGEWYKTKNIEKKGIERLRKEWQDLNEEWLAMPNDTQEEKDARRAFEESVTDARQLYYDALCDLVDNLLEEEYNHAQRRRENGIPYEPKPSFSERAFEMVKDLVE